MKRLLLLFVLMWGIEAKAIDTVDAVISKAIANNYVAREDARRIYLLRERFGPSGVRLHVYRMPPASEQHQGFLRDVLQMSVAAYEKETSKLTNAGFDAGIVTVKTARDMLDAISNRDYSVGYLDRNYIVLNIGASNAKVIRIVD